MSDPLLTISNNHTPNCGDPPIINDRDPNTYVGYFQNAFGEQWIFTCDRQSQRSELRGGDVGWNSPFVVESGTVPDLILNPDEAAWLKACWSTATKSV